MTAICPRYCGTGRVWAEVARPGSGVCVCSASALSGATAGQRGDSRAYTTPSSRSSRMITTTATMSPTIP